MQIAVMVAGAVAEFTGWWFVATGRAGVWKLMPLVLGTMGVAAVAASWPTVPPGQG